MTATIASSQMHLTVHQSICNAAVHVQHHTLQVGLATDVGAGTSLSMLKTMGDAYKVIQLRQQQDKQQQQQQQQQQEQQQQHSLSPLHLFHLATMGSAHALGIHHEVKLPPISPRLCNSREF
jgi:cytosine/adenosine deaminase-related metal-dependent hydrolase